MYTIVRLSSKTSWANICCCLMHDSRAHCRVTQPIAGSPQLAAFMGRKEKRRHFFKDFLSSGLRAMVRVEFYAGFLGSKPHWGFLLCKTSAMSPFVLLISGQIALLLCIQSGLCGYSWCSAKSPGELSSTGGSWYGEQLLSFHDMLPPLTRSYCA